ncbi:MAG: response regulator [Bacteroidetes bacterium]|nr:MAG: response regulator [Bacteroidota bacterium]
MVRCYTRIGSIYSLLEMHEAATEILLRAAKLSEAYGDTKVAAITYYQLGKVFFALENNVKAQSYFSQAIRLMEVQEDYNLHAVLSLALGTALRKSAPDSAIHLFKKAIDYCETQQTPYYLSAIYNNLGSLLKDQGQYEQALVNYRAGLKYATQFDQVHVLAELRANFGDVYLQQNKLDSAAYYLEQAREFGEASQDQTLLQGIYFRLSKLHEKKGDYRQAYQLLEKTFQIRDSIYNADVERQVQINVDQFQLERKEKQIAEQALELVQAENRNSRMLLIGIIALSLIVAGYQWYVYRQRQREQAAKLELRLEQAESQRLREIDKLKTDFFTNISHELRTPLTLILSPIADVIEAITSKPLRDKLGIVQRNGQRLLNLVNEIMDLSKVEAGKLEVHLSEVELTAFTKRVFSAFESLAAMRRITYQLELVVAPVYVRLDQEKVEKILHNLLANAIKFTPAQGKVSLKVSQYDELYTFAVSDTGPGIPASEQQAVFERYYQMPDEQQALRGGTGIGLALAKELAQLLGGAIELKSKPGEGSTFTFSVPLSTVSVPVAPIEHAIRSSVPASFASSYAPLTIGGEKPKLLIVEDHPEMGKYLLDILSDHYQCVLATDGTEALRQLKLTDFDCISSDVMMPNMDGFMLREKINENPHWRQIPFLLLTARHLEEDKLRGFQLGIDDYVTKPFSSRELHARIHNLVRNKLERDAYQADTEQTFSADQKQLAELEQIVRAHLDDDQFKVADLAAAVHYSSKQVGRIIKKYTGMSSVQFILEIRLQHARELLEKRQCASVIEAQYAVGIQSTSYFTRKFTERFGKNPSAFLEL